jgi:hypothetical protein
MKLISAIVNPNTLEAINVLFTMRSGFEKPAGFKSAIAGPGCQRQILTWQEPILWVNRGLADNMT